MDLEEFVKNSVEAVKSALASAVPNHQPVNLEIEVGIGPSANKSACPIEVEHDSSSNAVGRIKFTVTIAVASPRIG